LFQRILNAASLQELMFQSLDQIKQVHDVALRGDINSEQADGLIDGIIDRYSKASKSLADNKEIKNALAIASKYPDSNIHVRSVNGEVEIQSGGLPARNDVAPVCIAG
jgi:hypothetical protein